MYNRYIPQADGTYRRSRIPDPAAPPRHTPPKQEEHCPPPVTEPPHCPPPPPPEAPCRRDPYNSNVRSFLGQLLPKDFDTGDLIVILLLLLLAGDCQEDRNTALLTLALYLFM